jgi:hypothetical protein
MYIVVLYKVKIPVITRIAFVINTTLFYVRYTVAVLLISYFLKLTSKIGKYFLIYLQMNFWSVAFLFLMTIQMQFLKSIISEENWTIVSTFRILKNVKQK